VTVWQQSAVAEWEARGSYRELAGHRVFTVEVPPEGPERLEPLLVVHGFPTSSFDFHSVVGPLSAGRRVLLLDLLGYGLSAKPDLAYHLDLEAEVVAAYTASLGVTEVALLTHDVGDTVGGELLARQLEGRWPVSITRRVITNGSVYIAMAHLSTGQELLLALPDERLADDDLLNAATIGAGLAATFSPGAVVDGAELAAMSELVAHGGGNRLLPRLIRYIEERRRNERRYTGAIEAHPSPLAIVWGRDDPIAVPAIADRLAESRAGSPLTWLDGVGHYPMVEAPGAFAAAVLAHLG